MKEKLHLNEDQAESTITNRKSALRLKIYSIYNIRYFIGVKAYLALAICLNEPYYGFVKSIIEVSYEVHTGNRLCASCDALFGS